jgi:hypothetical protein
MPSHSAQAPKRLAPRDWVFPWGERKTPWLPKLVALLVAAGCFSFLLMVVRIQVTGPEPLPMRKGSVIYLTDDAVGRALTLRAHEGGPFPSRFDLSEWGGLSEMEKHAFAGLWVGTRPYQPPVADLSEDGGIRPLFLAAKGALFFPERRQVGRELADGGSWFLAPRLYPLAGISQGELPEVLPRFETAVDAEMSSASWRFLIQLDTRGGVTECVSLERGGDAGAAALESWLRQIRFRTGPEGVTSRWISLGVQFINQSADESDAR